MKASAIAGMLLLVGAAAGAMYLIARYGTTETTKAPAEQRVADDEAPPVSKTGPYPKATASELEFNFGTMAVAEERQHTFVIENKGEAPLVVKTGKPTCKCTVAKLDNYTVPVGEKVEVVLTWKPPAITPSFRQSVPVYTNDPENRELKLSVVGDVVDVLTLEPGGAWNLGDITKDEPVTVSGIVFSRTLDKFAITSVVSENKLLTTESAPMTEDELKEKKARSGYAVHATLAAGSPIGPIQIPLTITTDVNQKSDLKVTLQGTRPGPLKFLARPGTVWHPEVMALDLGEFPGKNGKKAQLMLFVYEMQDEDFQFTKVESDTPFLKVELKKDADFRSGGRQRFDLTFEVPPGSPPATMVRSGAATIKIFTNHPKAHEMKFRVEMVSI